MADLNALFSTMFCMKTILMLYNFAFLLSGLIITIIGVWMVTDLHKFMEMSTEFSETIPYVFIGIGASICIVGTLACMCTAKGQPSLLYIYGGYLAITFILELGAGISIYAYRNKLMIGFDKGLNDSMINYKSDNPALIADFDEMQETLQCCGNHKYSDWLDLSPPIPIPLSCCIVPNCDTADETKIYTEGCYNKVIGFLDANIGLIAGASIGVAFLPLLGMILACCLARSANKARYEQMA